MSFKIFWGDLHSHCSISYGHGTMDQALARARQQLDFCSITGHAFWPDMPTDRDRYGDIIDYHHEGFSRLAKNWPILLEKSEAATRNHEFIAFPSYEWHSLEFGDHNVYAPSADLPLLDAPDVATLRQLTSRQLAIPHHIGYRAGYRGINWDAYRERQSPFVEVFSLHGCSLSDDAPYPMLHDMGPRDSASTAEAGWARGFRFGIVGGTDHHAAYPGSHGDGRMAVLASSLTREALWDAFLARRVYALTGDRIEVRFEINDAPIGSQIPCQGDRKIRIRALGLDTLHTIELRKNGRPFRSWTPLPPPLNPSGLYRLRLTWGWGPKETPVDWAISLALEEGEIRSVDPLFSGQAIVSPQSDEVGSSADACLLPHEIFQSDDAGLSLKSITHGNLSMRHETTQGISLLLQGNLDTRLRLEVNGHPFHYPLRELVSGARSHFLRGWLSEAIRIGPLASEGACRFETELTDQPATEMDRYQLNISQRNGQWAWLTPIWVQQ